MNVEWIQRAKQQWQAAVDAMPQLICLLDKQGRVIRANRTLERWGLGDVAAARGTHLHDLLHPGCHDPDCYLPPFLAGAEADVATSLRARREVLDPHLSRHLSIHVQPLLRGTECDDSMCALVIIDDITAFKLLTQDLGSQLERETRQRAHSEGIRARLLAIIEKTPDLVAMADAAGSLIHLNPAGRTLLGLGPDDRVSALGLSRCLGGPGAGAEVDDRIAVALRDGIWKGEAALIDGSGHALPTSSVLLAHRGAGGEIEALSTIVRDLSERVLAEAQLRQSREDLRQLSASHVNMQEDERMRIAAEMHDGLGQSLSLIKLALEDASRRLCAGAASEVSNALKRLIPNVADAIHEVRRISMALRPPTLDDLGILATLCWFCRELAAVNPGLAIEKSFDVREDQVPGALKLPIFRIVQEATHNVLKHAKAKGLNIALTATDGELRLRIEDDGCGFDPAHARRKNGDAVGLGLLSMMERAMLSGGRYELQSSPGRGTAIHVMWRCGAAPNQPPSG